MPTQAQLSLYAQLARGSAFYVSNSSATQEAVLVPSNPPMRNLHGLPRKALLVFIHLGYIALCTMMTRCNYDVTLNTCSMCPSFDPIVQWLSTYLGCWRSKVLGRPPPEGAWTRVSLPSQYSNPNHHRSD